MGHASRNRTNRSKATHWLWTEAGAWSVGVTAVSVWVAMTGMARLGAAQGLREFADLKAAAELSILQAPDQRFWSAERRRAWAAGLQAEAPAPVAVLRIPRIALEVAVREGTGDWTLNQGVGLIEHTAQPGDGGNVGIAGHRDGFFRGLEAIQPGDVLEIETIGAVHSYLVERTWIVQRNEVSVLYPTAEPSVTLVTCYPFYFVGPAPERFIVRAVSTGTRASGSLGSTRDRQQRN